MPYSMWIGNNSTQFNATPHNNLTAAEANSIVGYTATGEDQMAAVMMEGEILGNNFQTTFNPTYGTNGSVGGSGGEGGTRMYYDSDVTGAVTDTRITTAVSTQIQVTDLDPDGEPYVVGTYTGAFIQMSNGDVFSSAGRPR